MTSTIRIGGLYGTMFLVIGIMMPFWPVWLEAKGLSPTQIGMVIAAGSVIRVFMSPLIARIADRTGERRRPLIIIATLAFVAFMPFSIADDFISILILQSIFAGLLGPLMPLSESLTMIGVKQRQMDYGRVRLWGSLTFILGASGIGFYLKGAEPSMIWTAIAIAMALHAASTFFVPDYRTKPGGSKNKPFRDVISDKTFLIFILAGAMIQGSHALYYTFGTINWLRMGFDEGTIGLLWALGVIAEVVLFIFGAKIVARVGPARLIALGGLACIIRWCLMGFTDALPMIVLLQLLHAFTFGATHIGAIYFISQRMPDTVSATAQTLYALIVSGLGIGLISLLSGFLYEAYGGHAYFLMGVLGAVGMILAWQIRRQ
jgi:PPP family 3-phenylpropionic acid transporter